MEWLRRKGYHDIRFWDSDILNNPEGLLERIREVVSRL